MDFLIILLLCLLATSKVTIQGFFGKNDMKTTPDAILFNGLVFVFSTAIFLPYLFNQTLPMIIFGAIFGLFTVIFQLTYLKALSTGAVSITVMIANLSTIIPITVSMFVYNEPVSLLRGIGIFLTLSAFVICTDFNSGKKGNIKWFILAIGGSIASGLCQVCQKMLTNDYTVTTPQSFVAISYLFSALLSVLFYLIIIAKGEKRTVKLNKKVFVGSLLVGISLGVFQAVYTYSASAIDGTLLYPAFSGGSLITSSLVGLLIFKDRLLTRQKISILVSITALVLMNL